MTDAALINLAPRVLAALQFNNDKAIDAIEEQYGPMSGLLDEIWDSADNAGKTDLVAKCERAFNRLTGRV